MARLDNFDENMDHPLYGAPILTPGEICCGEAAEDLERGVVEGVLYVCPANRGTCTVVPGHFGDAPVLHVAAGHTLAEYDALVDDPETHDAPLSH